MKKIIIIITIILFSFSCDKKLDNLNILIGQTYICTDDNFQYNRLYFYNDTGVEVLIQAYKDGPHYIEYTNYKFDYPKLDLGYAALKYFKFVNEDTIVWENTKDWRLKIFLKQKDK